MATDTAQPVSPVEDVYPLSALQENMLSCNRTTAVPGQDLEQVVGDLHEPLDTRAFVAAWESIVQRHAALRTGFAWGKFSRPQQEVHRQIQIPLTEVDWFALDPAQQERDFRNWLETDRRSGFDLSKPPLVRATLFRMAAARFRFVWSFHHALLDATSFTIVLEELFTFYEAFREGIELELPRPTAYREFIEHLEAPEDLEAKAFWTDMLADFGEPTPLVIGRACAQHQSEGRQFAEQTARLTRSETGQFRAFARSHGVTLSTLLSAVWGFLLGRYASVEDVVFGTVQAGRRKLGENASKLVGLLINTVPFRVKLVPGQSVSEWLAGVRRQQLALRPFEQTPLLRVLEWLPDWRGMPWFETIVSFQEPSWHDSLRSLGGDWKNREFRVYNQPGYPLWLDSWAGEEWHLRIGYDRNRFEDQTISRLLSHFQLVLTFIRTHPDAMVRDLPVMTEAERNQVVYDWNRTDAPLEDKRCAHDLFAEQAAKTPNALAVASSQRELTYAELNAFANQLGHFLRAGNDKGIRVAVCMDRSVEMAVAVLAILKAGGAFVPLDVNYPRERLEFMLEDSKATAIVTRGASGLDWLQGLPDRKLVHLDLDRPGDWGCCPRDNMVHGCEHSDLAYIIYTSGSSGRPKGVAIEHRGLLNLVSWHRRAYQVTAEDRATLLAGPAFDASVWELWPYLAAGASVHVPDEETRLSSRQLIHWLTANDITITFLPTPFAEALLGEAWPQNRRLRAVLTGGEKLHRRPHERFRPALFNHYGPTECSVVATAGLVSREPAGQSPPIGRPISNTRTYCLDSRLRPMPIGVPGELHLSGAGLARGYLNESELTAQKFIANPFAEPGYERLYKTGDLARWLPDGRLEFIGRIDEQIKIRGQRVELGEIESVLNAHPDVGEAVVKAHPSGDGIRLVAYVVKTSEANATAADFQAWLSRKLPRHMLPERINLLPKLPRTANGKINRSVLQPGEVPSTPGFIAPRTPTEEIVAGLWCEILERPQAGVGDNFFEMGGHSLHATRLLSRLRTIFQVELPYHCLFEAPTVAALAEQILKAQQQGQENAAPPLRAGEARETVVSFAQERLWFLEQWAPGLPLHNVPFAIRLCGTLHVAALERSLNEIVRRHKPLRTSFISVDGQLLPREDDPSSIELPPLELGELAPEAREQTAQLLVLKHARALFDLSRAPLLKATLLRLANQEHLLTITTHLIASDGWSIGVFYRELAALYEAFSQGRPSPLPELTVGYSDFALWQRRWLTGAVLETRLDYWRNQFRDGLPSLLLPTDFPRPATQTFTGATRFFALPEALTQALRKLSRAEGATLYMVLLAAFKTLLRRYSGSDAIVVGSPIAGRTLAATENLIGAFMNTLALRTDLSGDPAFQDLLSRVRETCLGAYQHQDVPLEKVVDALRAPRAASHFPLFQVMFTLQNVPLAPRELAGLQLKPLALEAGIAKLDLTLLLEESGQCLSGGIEYNTQLFAPGTVTQILANFQTLLERIVADPRQHLSVLTEGLTALAKSKTTVQVAATMASRQNRRKEQKMQADSLQIKPGHVRRKAVRIDPGEIVSLKPLLADRAAPILIEAKLEGTGLPEWARGNREQLDRLLLEHRALLFRNFAVKTVDQFRECVLATCNGELLNYVDRSTPRPSVGQKVYVSTIYPSAETINLHNEGTYWRAWPLKIYFCSLVTADSGGETPIADVRNVLRRLPPEIREKFQQKQVTYVRNYNDGFGLSWQETFQTQNRAEVEAYCRNNDIEFEWKEGDRLRTRQTRPAIRKHPITGEMVWFNHAAFFHVSSLAPQVRQELLAAFGENELPYNTYYGDGSRIEPEVATAIRDAYQQEKVVFPWRNGDVMLLDNMSMAHGRQPYQGKREVVVSMAEPCSAG